MLNHITNRSENPFPVWKPGFALLPSGVHLDTKFLKSQIDPVIFAEIFGVQADMPDEFTRNLILNGYADVAERATAAILKAMDFKP